MRLLIFTPTIADAMRPETAASIKAQQTAIPYTWEVGFHNPYPGEKNRNVVAQYQRARELCLAGDYDALLTVEHDMIIPPDTVEKLMSTPAPVVYGLYMLRHGTHTLNAWRYEGDRNLGMSLSLYPQEVKAARRRGWVRVCGVGWGCTLIRREVLERFQIHANDVSDAGDITFAAECLRARIEQIARFDVPCGHIDDDGTILDPFGEGGIVARAIALKDVNVQVDGQSKALRTGRYYTLPLTLAGELVRAGYVRITNDAEDPGETADDDQRTETAIAPAQRRKGKGKAH
jgi:hypothetical protein